LLAVTLVLGLVVIGCGDGGGGGPTEEPTTLILTDNFQYGTGYQGSIPWGNLASDNISVGDEYQLEIEFTVSRDLEDKLQWAIVDPSPPSYWTEVTKFKTVVKGTDEGVVEDPPEESPADGTPIVPSGEGFKTTDTVSYSGKAVAEIKGSKSIVALYFQTKGEGTKGNSGSGKKGPVTLTFTKFKVTKLGGEPTATYTESDLAFGKGSAGNPDTGAGNIEGEDFAKLKAAKPGSLVKITFDLSGYDNWDKNGWGFGAAGNEPNKEDGSNPNFMFNSAGVQNLTVEYDIEDFLGHVGSDETWIYLNVWGGAKITKVVLRAIN